jgi:hypothetical protein
MASVTHNGITSTTYYGSTDYLGALTPPLTGAFAAGDVGAWTETWTVGGIQATPTLSFSCNPNSYTISGRITTTTGAALSNATVRLSSGASAPTDANGNYSLNAAAGGTYTVTPEKATYWFNPASATFSNLGANQVANFAAAQVTVQLTNTTRPGNPNFLVGDAFRLVINGPPNQPVMASVTHNGVASTTSYGSTDSTGARTPPLTGTFAAGDVGAWTEVWTVGGIQATAVLTFTVTPDSYTISGTVTASGAGLSGVRVAVTGSESGITTDADGYFTYTAAAGGNYTITPSKSGYSLTPPSVSFTNLSANQTANFTAVAMVPTITSLSPASGLGGTVVTVSGSNFGATQGSSTVTFNGVAATSYRSWSGTSIQVVVPGGASTGDVVVHVAGGASNGMKFGIPPYLQTISPSHSARSAEVTLTGVNFGTSQSSSTVIFNGALAGAATAWSDTSITVAVPLSASTGSVVVTVDGVVSNAFAFTVDGPTVYSALSYSTSSASYGTASGTMTTKVEITGSGFGSDQGASRVTFSGVPIDVHDHTLCNNECEWSNTKIRVQVPPGARTGDVLVTVNSQASNPVLFTMVPPVVTSIVNRSSSPPCPADAYCGYFEDIIEIHGGNFGADQIIRGDPVNDHAVKFNGVTGPSVHGPKCSDCSWSDQVIRIQIPLGPLALTGDLVVRSNGMESRPVRFVMLSPTIMSISTQIGARGTPVTITGANFGASQGTSAVYFYYNDFLDRAAGLVSSWTDTSISLAVPQEAVTGWVVVDVNGHGSNGVTFMVSGSEPTITNVFPPAGPIGSEVSISGVNFGKSATGMILFNGVRATPTTWTPTSITTQVPTGATTGPVVVKANALTSDGLPFTVTDAPVVYSVSPASGLPGTRIMITGTRFGPTKGSAGRVTIGGVVATVASWSDATVWAVVPTPPSPSGSVKRAGGSAEVVVMNANGARSVTTPGAYFSIECCGALPYLGSISPSYAVPGQKGTAVITGENLTGVTFTGIPGVSVTVKSVSPDGRTLTIDFVVAADAAGGVRILQFQNGSGTGSVTFTIGAPPPRIEQIGWSNQNRMPLSEAMTFASNGDYAIGTVVWYDPALVGMPIEYHPAAFAGGFASGLASVVLRTDPLFSGTANLRVSAIPAEIGFAIVPATFSAGVATIPYIPMTTPFPAVISRREYQLEWAIDFGKGFQPFQTTAHTVYLVYKVPGSVTGVTTKRLDYVVSKTSGTFSLVAATAALAAAADSYPRFYGGCHATTDVQLWQAMDSLPSSCGGLDCASLAGLVGVQLQQLGWVTGRVELAYATTDADVQTQEKTKVGDDTFSVAFGDDQNFYEGYLLFPPGGDVESPTAFTIHPWSGPLSETGCNIGQSSWENRVGFRALTYVFKIMESQIGRELRQYWLWEPALNPGRTPPGTNRFGDLAFPRDGCPPSEAK